MLASVVTTLGCTKIPEIDRQEDGLTPVGMSALFNETMVSRAIDAEAILGERIPESYLCYTAKGTPITSVHNSAETGITHAILEKDSEEEFGNDSTRMFRNCRKGAIIKMRNDVFDQSVLYPIAESSREVQQRQVEKEIREVLKQRQYDKNA